MLKRRFFLLSFVSPLLIISGLIAQTPLLINYQGHLTDENGDPRIGSFTVQFAIYNDEAAGSLLWSENHPGLFVTNGLLNVLLGSVTPFPSDLFSGTDLRYLQISVGAETLTPRQRITSVAYAIHAHEADSAGTIADDSIVPSKIMNGAITGPKIFNGAVGTAKIEDDAVTSAKIADGTIATGDIANNAVTSAKIASGAVGSAQILDGSITAGDLATGAITIQDNSVTSIKIVDGAVSTADIANSAVTGAKIAPGGVGSAEIADNTVAAIDIAAGAVGVSELADNAVSNIKMADNSVSTAEITDNAVTSAKIALNTIVADDIATSGVGTLEIADNAVTSAKIALNTIIADDIANDGVGAAEIAANAVGNSEMADNAIGSAEIINNSIIDDDMADEAGVEFFNSGGGSAGYTISSTSGTLASVTIVAPTSGFVIVTATGSIGWDIATAAQGMMRLKVSVTSGETGEGSGGLQFLRFQSGLGTGSFFFPLSITKTFSVNAGSNRFYLNGWHQIVNGTAYVDDFSLTALFVPTQY